MPTPKSVEVVVSATMNRVIGDKKIQVIWFDICGTNNEAEIAITDGTRLSEGDKLIITYKDGDDGELIDPVTSRVRSPSEIISSITYNNKVLKIKFLK